MAAAPTDDGAIGPEILALEVLERNMLPVRVGVDDCPTLDAVLQIGALARDLAAPRGSPANGDRYIVAPSASGAWLGKEGQIAAFQDGAWSFYPPREGWIARVAYWVGWRASI